VGSQSAGPVGLATESRAHGGYQLPSNAGCALWTLPCKVGHVSRVASLDPPDPDLASAIRRIRLEHGDTLETVAAAAGLSLDSYSRIERGQSNPAWTSVRRIARALDMTLGELVAAAEGEQG
jgi:DNA-binding XRE family transcriptional regulator